VKPRRADAAARIVLVALSRLIEWRGILTIVKPADVSGSYEAGHQRREAGRRLSPRGPPT